MDLMKRLLASLSLVSLVVLAGCGGTAAPSTGTQPAAGTKAIHLKLATSTPLSGTGAAVGVAVKFGAQIALDDRKADLTKAGLEIELFPQDDEAKGDVGAQIATRLLSDQQVIGIVGTLFSGVAKAEMPLLKDSGLVMVSPANTAIVLTESGYTNYNRVVFRDDTQGPGGARYAKSIGVKSVWVMDDQGEYGKGLAAAFKAEAEKQGLKVLGYSPTQDKQADFGAELTKIAEAKPDLIFYGGYEVGGSNLIKQAKAKMPNVKLMGGDGWDNPDLGKLSGKDVDGVLFTTVDADLTTKPAQDFVTKFKKAAGSTDDPPSYALYGYDCANIIINALIKYATANPGKTPARADIAKLVRATKDFKGIAATVTFNEKGDNPTATVFVKKYDAAGKDSKIGPAPLS